MMVVRTSCVHGSPSLSALAKRCAFELKILGRKPRSEKAKAVGDCFPSCTKEHFLRVEGLGWMSKEI
jgi:hypothetical protein